MNEPGTNNMVDILETFLQSRFSDLHTSIPGKIVSYNETTERAIVQPLVKLHRKIGEKIVSVEIQPIENVPVMMLHTSQFKLKVPIKKDDGCEIRFSEVGIGNFLNGNGSVVAPDDISKFSLTDAYCIPGLWGNNLPTNSPTIEVTEAGQLKLLDGAVNIEETKIDLLAGTSSFTKGEDLETLLNTFFNDSWMLLPAGTTVQNAAILTALQISATAAKSLVSSIKSLKIKGE